MGLCVQQHTAENIEFTIFNSKYQSKIHHTVKWKDRGSFFLRSGLSIRFSDDGKVTQQIIIIIVKA